MIFAHVYKKKKFDTHYAWKFTGAALVGLVLASIIVNTVLSTGFLMGLAPVLLLGGAICWIVYGALRLAEYARGHSKPSSPVPSAARSFSPTYSRAGSDRAPIAESSMAETAIEETAALPVTRVSVAQRM